MGVWANIGVEGVGNEEKEIEKKQTLRLERANYYMCSQVSFEFG